MNEGVKTCGRPPRGRYASGCRCNACKSANDKYEYERVRGARYMTTPEETDRARRCGCEFAPRFTNQRTCDACLGR